MQIKTFGLNRDGFPVVVGSEEEDAELEREVTRLADAMEDEILDEDEQGAESLVAS
jgi:hypothetical protein